jgi:hypothetical protein
LIPIVPETENFADRPNSLSKSKAKNFGGSESGLCAWAEKISAGKSVCYCAENDRVGVGVAARAAPQVPWRIRRHEHNQRFVSQLGEDDPGQVAFIAEEGEAILPRINPSARSGDDRLRMTTCVLGSSSRMIAITAGSHSNS